MEKIISIGHSTYPSNVFGQALVKNGVKTLVDIRSIPKSLHNPQYQHYNMAFWLKKDFGIEYKWLKLLGGYRGKHLSKFESPNGAWEKSSFRNYADYMQTPSFNNGLEELMKMDNHCAIMCSECVPWRCHRRLVSDALIAHGIKVFDVIPPDNSPRMHLPTKFASICGANVTYPSNQILFTFKEEL